MALSGNHLRVVAGLWNPWVLFEHNQAGELTGVSGIFIDFLDIFARNLNFTYTIVEVPDGEWGRILKNGSTTGMIGMCQRKEVDMALGPFSITYVRSLIIDYSATIYVDNTGIILPRPTRQKDLVGFSKPFAWQVWLALLISIVVSMALGTAMDLFVRRKVKREDIPPLVTFRPIWIIKLLLLEAINFPPMLQTGRLFLGTWMIASLILSLAYQGILTSLLAVTRVNIPVDSLQDLIDYGKIPWAIERGTSTHQFFGDAKSGIYKEIHDGAFLAMACYDEREHMKKEKFSIFCDFFSMKKIMSDDYSETGKCNFYIAKQSIWSTSYAFAFPKKSTIIPHFDRMITRMKEGGIFSRYNQQFTLNATACMVKPGKEDGHKTLVLSIGDLGGIFLLYLGGLLLGTLVFIVELMIKREPLNSKIQL